MELNPDHRYTTRQTGPNSCTHEKSEMRKKSLTETSRTHSKKMINVRKETNNIKANWRRLARL
jgi:hypothetical protein